MLGQEIVEQAGQPLAEPVATLRKQAQDAGDAGLLNNPQTKGIYDLGLLNEVLKSKSQSAVAS